MPTYSNGYIPLDLLVTFKRGWNSTDGDWHHSLSPATYARHLALVARAFKRTGRTIAISFGWSAYRPYSAQVLARKIWGLGAATPGTSSHGGFWEGKQTLAMDYGNWDWVYQSSGGMSVFFEDCRAVGLLPGMIMRSRGYPDEPWHVIDPNPWSAVPAFEGATEFAPEVVIEEEVDMSGIPALVIGAGDTAGRVWAVEGGRKRHVQPAEMDVYRELAKVRDEDLHIVTALTIGRVAGIPTAVDGVSAAQVEAIVSKLGSAPIAGVDAAAIAQAVNDEADARALDRLQG